MPFTDLTRVPKVTILKRPMDVAPAVSPEDVQRVQDLLDASCKTGNIVFPEEAFKDKGQGNFLMNEELKRQNGLILLRRNDPGAGQACVCLILKPSDATKLLHEPGHACHDHVTKWFHFFHCVRVEAEDYAVFWFMMGHCQCEACAHYVRIFQDGVKREEERERLFQEAMKAYTTIR